MPWPPTSLHPADGPGEERLDGLGQSESSDVDMSHPHEASSYQAWDTLRQDRPISAGQHRHSVKVVACCCCCCCCCLLMGLSCSSRLLLTFVVVAPSRGFKAILLQGCLSYFWQAGSRRAKIQYLEYVGLDGPRTWVVGTPAQCHQTRMVWAK